MSPLFKATGSFLNLNASGTALGEFSPVNHGLLGWSFDPSAASNGTLLTGGTVYLSAVIPAKAGAVTRLFWHVTAVGATPTSNQNKVGLFGADGTLLQSTVVDADISSTGLKTTTITSQAVTAGALYWVGMVFNASTIPTVSRGNGLGGAGTGLEPGLTAAGFRYATNGTGQTTLASITPASNTAGTFAGPWVAIGA